MKYTLRDLLWLTAIVAILVAWWIDHAAITKIRRGEQESFDLESRLLTEEMERLRTEYAQLERRVNP